MIQSEEYLSETRYTGRFVFGHAAPGSRRAEGNFGLRATESPGALGIQIKLGIAETRCSGKLDSGNR